jgi:hypothetical protein
MKTGRVRFEAIRNGQVVADAPTVPQHIDAARSLLFRRTHVGLVLGRNDGGHYRKRECDEL